MSAKARRDVDASRTPGVVVVVMSDVPNKVSTVCGHDRQNAAWCACASMRAKLLETAVSTGWLVLP